MRSDLPDGGYELKTSGNAKAPIARSTARPRSRGPLSSAGATRPSTSERSSDTGASRSNERDPPDAPNQRAGPNARAILCVGIVVAATPRRKGRGPVRRLSVRLYPDAAIPDAPGERQRGQAVPAVDDDQELGEPGRVHGAPARVAGLGDDRPDVGPGAPRVGLGPHGPNLVLGGERVSTDPLFIEKVRDIVGLYLAPPERALVLSVDEKSQI